MTPEFYIDDTNSEFGSVVRWVSSNNIPFPDMLTEFLVKGLIDQQTVTNSITARKIEDAISIEAYIKMRQRVGYSDEERFEMRAAFGDEQVVDMFTGEMIKL